MPNERYKVIYEIKSNKKDNKIKILGKNFVENNKIRGSIIYNNKRLPLQENITVLTSNKRNKEIKLNLIFYGNIYNKSYMFKDCKSLVELTQIETKKQITNLYFKNKFEKEKYMKKLEILYHNAKLILNSESDLTYKNAYIYGYYPIISLININILYTNIVNQIHYMFYNCKLLKTINISQWNTQKVISFAYIIIVQD